MSTRGCFGMRTGMRVVAKVGAGSGRWLGWFGSGGSVAMLALVSACAPVRRSGTDSTEVGVSGLAPGARASGGAATQATEDAGIADAVEPSAADLPREGEVGGECVGDQGACAGVDQVLACAQGRYEAVARCEGVCRTLGSTASCIGTCKPNTRGCSPDGLPQVCDGEGRFQLESPCAPAAPACFAGACVVCEPGARRCNTAGAPELCRAEGSGYEAATPCAGEAALCIPETGECGQCSEGSVRVCEGQLGNCAQGEQSCVGGAWGPCSVERATADTCIPGDDANCNGTPNEGCACAGDTPCGSAVGQCRPGTSSCVNGTPGQCVDQTPPRSRDCSSPFDNNCDGVVDNTLDAVCQCALGSTQNCNAHPGLDGRGICRAGSQRCLPAAGNVASAFGICENAVGPQPRDCRSVQDNDCDGIPDNTVDGACQCRPGEQRSCGAEAGSLGCRQGTQLCQASVSGSQSAWGACAFAPVNNGTTCNDNNAQTINDRCQNGACIGSTATCGNGVAEGNEACDDGNTSNVDGCTNTCALPRCGDGFVQPARGETCDDRNTVSGDGCTPRCEIAHAPVGASAFGGTHVCMLRANGNVVCWGTNSAGELGPLTTTGGLGPTAIDISGVVQIALGPSRTCAVQSTGSLQCWGRGFTTRPTEIATGVSQVAISRDEVCALRASGVVACTPGAAPLADKGVASVTQLSAGDGQMCALRSDGRLLCWGSNNAGQLGIGEVGNPIASPVLSQPVGVAEVAAGGLATCVRLANGDTQCFGAGSLLGSPTAPNFSATPLQVINLPDPLRLASATNYFCALLRDQSVRCWGGGDESGASPTPTTIALPGRAVEIGAGSNVACAVLEDTTVHCWGPQLSILGLTPAAGGDQVPVRLPVPLR
jgi:cysteine-rich repeat protein